MSADSSRQSRLAPHPPVGEPTLAAITEYYSEKTALILERFGPGPRVHYHTGYVASVPQHATIWQLQHALLDSQTHMLEYAARSWDAPATLSGDVLDIGCGLGGGSIFWAERFGARVTALSCVAEHLDWVSRFAAEVRLAGRVVPLLCDAVEAPGEECYDAAVAVESSLYFLREPWMRTVARLLRPGGRLFVIDCFLGECSYAEPFNRHWRARIGTLDEYFSAARNAGLAVTSCEDISEIAANFVTISLKLLHAERRVTSPKASAADRLTASCEMHRLVREGLLTGGLRYALLSFAK